MKRSKIKNNFRNNNKSLKIRRNKKRLMSKKIKSIFMSNKSKLKKKKRYSLKGGSVPGAIYLTSSETETEIISSSKSETEIISIFNEAIRKKLTEIFSEYDDTSSILETSYNKTDKLTDWEKAININKDCKTILSSGKFGSIVSKTYNSEEGVVVKFSNKKDPKEEIELIREIAITLYIGEHDNIANVKGFARLKLCDVGTCSTDEKEEEVENGEKKKAPCCPCDATNTYSLFGLVMTEYEKDLNTYLKSKHEFKDHNPIIKGVCKGLIFLHSKNILHFDIHIGNILLTKENTVKITDFGISLLVKNDASQWPFVGIKTMKVNNRVIPPEIFITPPTKLEYNKTLWTEQTQNIFKIDSWGFGTLIYELLTCKKLFNVIIDDYNQHILRCEQSLLDTIINDIQIINGLKNWKKILLDCLQIKNSKRKFITELDLNLEELPGSIQCKDNIDISLGEYIEIDPDRNDEYATIDESSYEFKSNYLYMDNGSIQIIKSLSEPTWRKTIPKTSPPQHTRNSRDRDGNEKEETRINMLYYQIYQESPPTLPNPRDEKWTDNEYKYIYFINEQIERIVNWININGQQLEDPVNLPNSQQTSMLINLDT